MIFKLHYWFMAAGANAVSILLGVFLTAYTDFSPTEIGIVYMLMPLCSVICRPIVCSFADRNAAHRKYMINSLLITGVTYLPFVIIPLIGPQFYEGHPRISGYSLLFFKVVGTIAFSSAGSMGDSLAINYAHRVGANFGVYRVWGTISWIVFGVLVGQINEIWFLPKYVPGFMILIMSSLIDALLIWLWPAEYFIMVPMNQTLKDTPESDEPKKTESKGAKTLMPREVVWAQAKRKMLALFTCSCFNYQDQTVKSTQTMASPHLPDGQQTGNNETSNTIDRKTQISILLLLLRRDPRILLYFLVFVFGGLSTVPLSFFFMSLAEICRETGSCDFSQLGGLLQMSMASIETGVYVYIGTIIKKIGRLNVLSIAFALGFIKFGFYGTVWSSVNPYWSLLSESCTGIMYATYLVLMVELAHFFSNEVEFIIPELVERGIVSANDEDTCGKLKLSLSATMQALMSSANDGIGNGIGALVYGILIDRYSYNTLWLIIAIGCACIFIAIQTINIIDNCLNLRLGLDEQFKKKIGDREANSFRMPAIKDKTNNLGDSLDSVSVHSGNPPTAKSTDTKKQNAQS